MDLQYDGSLIDLLMNDTDLYDDIIQSNPTVLALVQNEVVPILKKSQRAKNFSVEEYKLIVSAWLYRRIIIFLIFIWAVKISNLNFND